MELFVLLKEFMYGYGVDRYSICQAVKDHHEWMTDVAGGAAFPGQGSAPLACRS